MGESTCEEDSLKREGGGTKDSDVMLARAESRCTYRHEAEDGCSEGEEDQHSGRGTKEGSRQVNTHKVQRYTRM